MFHCRSACLYRAHGLCDHIAERASPDDPFEPMNRTILDVNTALDNAVIKPAAEFYRDVVPPF
jgi:phospholipid-binding lipoprotein MlaA